MKNLTVPNITVLIADDHALFADGLEAIINQTEGFEVVAKVANGLELRAKLNSSIQAPDVILLDIYMPEMNGFESAAEIRIKYPDTRIIFVSSEYKAKYKKFIDQQNIHGFVIKIAGAPKFRSALQSVIDGEKVIITGDQHIKMRVEPQSDMARKFNLSLAETDIICLIVASLSSKQIAGKRKSTTATVDTQRKAIHKKLGVHSVAELIAFAWKEGICKEVRDN